MAIIKEYRCAAHGEFVATLPLCPSGCSPRFVVQEFRTAPAIKHGGTARVDRELGLLAKDYGMTDIHNGADGQSVMETMRKNPTHQPTWGSVQHNDPGWSGRGESAKTFAPGSMGVQGANVIEQVKPTLPGPKPLLTHQPYRPKP